MGHSVLFVLFMFHLQWTYNIILVPDVQHSEETFLCLTKLDKSRVHLRSEKYLQDNPLSSRC